MSVSNFDVFKEMCERNSQGITLSALSNVTEMRLTQKGKNTKITIGVVGDVLNPIGRGQMIGGLILADKKEFDAIKQELQERAASFKDKGEETQ